MNAKIIYGLCGAAHSGKDTVASFISEFKEDTEIISFAGPIKDACKILYNLSDEQLNDPVIKEQIDERWNKSPRQIFQWFGTDIMRKNAGENFFLKNMEQRLMASKAKCIVISDVRFENELEFVHKLDGIFIKITRPNKETTKHNKHISEQDLAGIFMEYNIINDGTLEELKEKIKSITSKT